MLVGTDTGAKRCERLIDLQRFAHPLSDCVTIVSTRVPRERWANPDDVVGKQPGMLTETSLDCERMRLKVSIRT